MSAMTPGRAGFQILIDLKSLDPVAVTATEAVQVLLGFGSRLRALHHRRIAELVIAPAEAVSLASIPDRLDAYLAETATFWNPNKERAWVRKIGTGPGGAAWEIRSGGIRRECAFGEPDVARSDFDHLVVWNREAVAAPPDLRPAFHPASVVAYRGAELYSIGWDEAAGADERAGWTREVAVVRSRKHGLLVHPHFQDHRVFPGGLPTRIWEEASS